MAKRIPTSTDPTSYTVNVVSFSVVRETAPRDSRRRQVISAPDDAATILRALIADDAREHFVILMLDAQNRLVASHEVSVGTLSSSLVHPREVFGPAMRIMGVASLILCHNHPSGDCAPSREDLRLTRQLVEAGKLLEIRIHDHLIIAHNPPDHVSLASRGQL
jgi:DNA repair protein RadC